MKKYYFIFCMAIFSSAIFPQTSHNYPDNELDFSNSHTKQKGSNNSKTNTLISIYPNPSYGTVYIESSIQTSKKQSFSITDKKGKQLHNEMLFPEKPVAVQLTPGTYYLRNLSNPKSKPVKIKVLPVI